MIIHTISYEEYELDFQNLFIIFIFFWHNNNWQLNQTI
jgi:hypothetical protein